VLQGVGYSLSIGVVVLAYLTGQLGGNVPIPGGVAELDASRARPSTLTERSS
jgi:hypothetical protein